MEKDKSYEMVNDKYPIVLVTSNPKKVEVAKRAVSDILVAEPMFDEEEIKASLSPSLGIAYPIEISKEKLKQHLTHSLEAINNPDKVFFVSDSVVLISDQDNKFIPINRDSPEDHEMALQSIKENREITFVGGISFGSVNSTIFSIGTWMKAKFKPDFFPQKFPLTIDTIDSISENFTTGFVTYDPKKHQFFLTSNNIVNDFYHARPFISGLVPEIIKLIEDFAVINREVSPTLRRIVSNYPFNTLSFYTRNPDYTNTDLNYWLEWVERYGGNCSLLALKTATEENVKKFNPRIVLFPSSKPNHPNGHGALVCQSGNTHFLIEPGFSIPFPIPILDNLLPFEIRGGNRKVFVTSENGSVSLHLLDKQTKLSTKRTFSLEEFTPFLPQILSELQTLRNLIKIDYHDTQGNLIEGLRIQVNSDRLKIKALFRGNEISIDELSEGLKEELEIFLNLYSKNESEENNSE